MHKIALSALALLALSGAATQAAAQERWNTPASACTAVSGQDLMQVTGSKVAFAPGKVGKIVLMCPITDSRGGVVNGTQTIYQTGVISDLRIAYQSSVGASESASVIAELIRTAFTTAVPTSMATFKSYAFPVTTYTNQSTTIEGPYLTRFDFGPFVYHVQVTLNRTAPTQAVSVTAISITGRVLPL